MMLKSAVQKGDQLRTISASRRTDMVASNPQNLAQLLYEKAPPDSTHTLVLWTKNPHNILFDKVLRSRLEKYNQLFLHLSITGLGATMLEPGAPPADTVLSMLPALADFLSGPERINIRFDPIVHFKLLDNSLVCNLEYFSYLAPAISDVGITRAFTSWVQIYGKVASRLNKLGIKAVELTDEKLRNEAEWLQQVARKNDIDLLGCCVPNWPRSSCIDGSLLNQLNPLGNKTSIRRAKGQRKLCGCTESLDIGWYHSCMHGCVYCYGNPQTCTLGQNREN
jgi:hypothetical protein